MDVTSLEAERRRRVIQQARVENDQARAEIDFDNIARAFTAPVKDMLTRDREWFAERDARWAQEAAEAEREQAQGASTDLLAEVDRRIRAAVLMASREVAAALKRDGRALDSELRELREMLTDTLRNFVALTKEVEQQPDLASMQRTVDKLEARCSELQSTMQKYFDAHRSSSGEVIDLPSRRIN